MTTVRLRESLNAPCGVAVLSVCLCSLYPSKLLLLPYRCTVSLGLCFKYQSVCVAKTFPSETSPFPLKILPKLPDGFYPLRFLTDISLVKITPSTNPPETSPDLSLDISPHRVATGHFSP